MAWFRAYRLELTFAAAVGLGAWAAMAETILWLPLLAAAIVSGGVLLARHGRRILQPLLWRLRDRLIVAYLFMAVIPIVLLGLLSVTAARYIAGQVAVHLVQTELDRRITALSEAAWMLTHARPDDRARLADAIRLTSGERFPDLEINLETRASGAGSRGASAGLVVKERKVYLWARAVAEKAESVLMMPVTRRWMAELVPGVGAVTLLSDETPRQRLDLHANDDDGMMAPALPASAGRFDFEVLWGSDTRIDVWESPHRKERAILAVRSRMSALLKVLRPRDSRADIPNLLYLYGLLFALVEVISIYLGVSITRTITGAVRNLSDGTARVMAGDFSHRIPVTGSDQIAGLGVSFNKMTENVERLLRVAKENERLQAELEIARQVQAQLFPRAAPQMRRLELKAFCNAARMVSGDYYDYQALDGNRVALALGDVAGKGVSAALLMASLQACLRMQLPEMASGDIGQVMSRINVQLHASTAPEKYATFFLAVYDDSTGSLTYTNAGHLPPVLIRQGKAAMLDVNGIPVGAFPFARYEQSRLVLEPGDLLVGYTDGVTEPENEFGEMFGEQRLVDVLLKSARLEPEAILAAVADAVRSFTGSPELQDDMTLMIARRR